MRVVTDSSHLFAKTYLAIWGWLAGLMLLGVGLSALPISKRTVVLLVLALSSIKATLVALYYMHLKFDRRVLTIVLLAPLALILLALSVVFSSYFVHLSVTQTAHIAPPLAHVGEPLKQTGP